MPKIFRETPPIDLVERFLSAYSIRGLTDTTWFSKVSNLSKIDDLLPELEPYYMPCKAKDYINTPLTQDKGITILRQLLTAHSIQLIAREKTCAGVKGMWYQLPTPSTTAEIFMSFP
jgi:hypothetical protein